jgi:predicted DNA-binding transcriptional regulator YafY
MRSATLTKEKFEPREGFEPTRLRDARTVKLLYDKAIARYAVERGARPLADGTALREVSVGSDEWLEGEVLALRGEAVLLAPAELRKSVAARTKALAKELGVERLRAPAA